MTVEEVLKRARGTLIANNIEDARLECELLLRHILAVGQVQLYLDFDCELNPEQEEDFRSLIGRRLSGEPTAYIIGHREFYGLDFYVEPSVLIPRPESELLVEHALQLTQTHTVSSIADIGTGCGAIAVSLALNLPQAKIYATDISASALKVALLNCQKNAVVNRICLLQGDLLEPLPEPVDLIIANLPYVRERELGSAGFEPLLALNGGRDGLEKIFQLCRQVGDRLRPGGSLLLEIGQGQAKTVTAFLHRLSPSARIEVLPDLSDIDRVVSLTFTTASSAEFDIKLQRC